MKTPVTGSKNRALEIVQTAKTDTSRAEEQALLLIRELAPELGTEHLSINESKLSLNSVNGSIDAGKKRYFFKFHAEEGETETLKDSEYYNAKMLADAGWPVVLPVFVSNTPGNQFVVYDYIEAPTAFELYEKLEESNGNASGLLAAEKTLAGKVRNAYLSSLQESTREDIEAASLNQLFYGRLVSKEPRLEEYYLGKKVSLPEGDIAFDQLVKMQWVINGVRYEKTLEEMIESAKGLLDPSKEERVATVVGHGDDHNGNRFFIDGEFKFFDTAFAGRQPALLSFVKATAHNVFLHPQWLYDPEKLEGKLNIKVGIKDDIVTVEHNWKTEELSPLRLSILDIYAKEVWKPLIQEMSAKGMLPDYWREYIRAALFCCPFLVQNLIGEKYAPAQSILALSKCVELGSRGDAETTIEKFLKSIAPRV
jgi:hypothetical protein